MVPHTKQDDSLQPGDQVYIKFVEFVAEEDFQPCFALPGLSHDTLAKVYEVGVYGDEDDDFQVGWIAMEALRPEPMFQLIQEMFRVEPDYVLTESDALAIGHSLGAALEHLHSQGLCCREISLHNVLVSSDGRLKLSCYGLGMGFTTGEEEEEDGCLFQRMSRPEDMKRFEKSPGFQAPETRLACVGGDETPYDAGKAEVWSLGVVIWCLLQARLQTEWRTGGSGPLPFGSAEDFSMLTYETLLGRGESHDLRGLLGKHEESAAWMEYLKEVANSAKARERRQQEDPLQDGETEGASKRHNQ